MVWFLDLDMFSVKNVKISDQRAVHIIWFPTAFEKYIWAIDLSLFIRVEKRLK